jgi:DNA segregation ATPase FtsK/SpoIIIE, S-DNA-T family
MSADPTPGQPERDTGPGGEVVDLDTWTRAARPATDPEAITAPAEQGTAPDAPPPAGGEDTGPVLEGTIVRVDQPGTGRRDGEWLAALKDAASHRRPVIHPLLRSRAELAATARWVSAHYALTSAYHATRTPKYAARLAFRSPRGASRVTGGLYRWALDIEGMPVRVATVLKGDAETYLKLSRQRDARVRFRLPAALGGVVITLALTITVAVAAPGIVQLGIISALVAVLGLLGKPADAPPLIDRAVVSTRVEKLTSEIVYRALGNAGIAALSAAITKNPRAALEFRSPIARDGGAGWRADLDLPYGVTVAEVQEKREKLASGLRRPVGCVWPEVDATAHPGRLILFVGDQDMSKAKQPAWPLAKHGAANLFKPQALGTDQRGRIVPITLMFVSIIIGSIPRMGKTFLLRLILLIAALDPRAEIHAYDLKGTGDLSPLEAVAHRYRAGDDDDDIAYALASMRAVREEMRRRTKVIRNLDRGICPENKVTAELASKPSLGLHPIVIGVDECQVWFEHKEHGAEFEEICTDIVKRGPATGIVLALATQRPDSKSIPTGISANAVLRLCLKVMGQTENDMVLGTSAYKNGTRATMFAFSDKGICYFSGEGDAPRITRSFYIDAPAAEKIAARARHLRQQAGTLSGHALGEELPEDTGPVFDLLADIAAVVTEPKLWSETVVTRLAELRPGTYAPWGDLKPEDRAAQLTAALRPYHVRTGQVWGTAADGEGANRRGITLADITKALTDRNRNGGPGTAA